MIIHDKCAAFEAELNILKKELEKERERSKILVEALEYLSKITVLPEKVKPIINEALAKYKGETK